MATEGIGHNSVAASELRTLVERIERLVEERSDLNADIRSVFAEGKATGYDTKTIRKVVAIRKMDKDRRAEEEALLDTYLSALGLL